MERLGSALFGEHTTRPSGCARGRLIRPGRRGRAHCSNDWPAKRHTRGTSSECTGGAAAWTRRTSCCGQPETAAGALASCVARPTAKVTTPRKATPTKAGRQQKVPVTPCARHGRLKKSDKKRAADRGGGGQADRQHDAGRRQGPVGGPTAGQGAPGSRARRRPASCVRLDSPIPVQQVDLTSKEPPPCRRHAHPDNALRPGHQFPWCGGAIPRGRLGLFLTNNGQLSVS